MAYRSHTTQVDRCDASLCRFRHRHRSRRAVAAVSLIGAMVAMFLPTPIASAFQERSAPLRLPPKDTPNPPIPTEDNPATAGLADPFFKGNLREAHIEAKRRHRLLIVYHCNPRHPSYDLVERRVWQNPIVRAWIGWHGVVHRATDAEYAQLRRSYGYGDSPMNDKLSRNFMKVQIDGPIFYCFADGKIMDIWNVLQSDNLGGFHCDAEVARVGGLMASGAVSYFDFTLRRAMAMDQLFKLLHEQSNPEPMAPPRPDPLWQTGDEWAPSLLESLDNLGLDPSNALDDPLEFLLRARRLVDDGFTRDAVTHYTWLWNRTDERAPWLRAWRRTIVQADIAGLTGKSESAQNRFDTLRSIETHRLAWAQWPEMYDWMLLSYASGKSADVFLYGWGLALPEDQTLTTAIESRVYRAMLARNDMANPWEMPTGDPVKRAADLWTLASMGHTRHSTEKELTEARSFLRELAHDECCRLHAACLLLARDSDAQRIATLLLSRTENPSDAAVAMLAVALGAGIDPSRLGHVIAPIADDDRALRLPSWSASLERGPR